MPERSITPLYATQLTDVRHALQLPTDGRIVVVGSAALEGLRQIGDVDLLADPNTFAKFSERFPPDSARGFRSISFTVNGIPVEMFGMDGPYSGEGCYPTKRELVRSAKANIIGGLPVVGLEEIGQIKEGMRAEYERTKDGNDLKLIRERLRSSH